MTATALSGPLARDELSTGRPHPVRTGGAPSLSPRTVFISDVHLGTRGCKAEKLVRFLRRTPCQTLYLVGDIFDGWRLRRRWFWPATHNAVVQLILDKAHEGTRVIYVPGNHDECMRGHLGITLASVEVHGEMIHRTADGRAFVVLHGDCVDQQIRHAALASTLGNWAYETALWVSERVNTMRSRLGYRPFSLASYLKQNVKSAAAYIAKFEAAVAREAHARGVDGVICGHIHHANIRRIDRVTYCNDGDWVESCTALVERHDGSLAVVDADGTVLVEEPRIRAMAAA